MTVGDDADLLSVSKLNEVWVSVNIYANNLPFVKNGAPVKITTLAYKGETFDGYIDQVANFFDPEERVKARKVVEQRPEIEAGHERGCAGRKGCFGTGRAYAGNSERCHYPP
jgi:hypothetical protein